MECKLWVELVEGVINVCARGELTEDKVHAIHDRILSIVNEVKCRAVLVDVQEMRPPTLELVSLQRKMKQELDAADVRLAVLVASTKAAYLMRLAYGESNYRVFYHDKDAALDWLKQYK